MTEPGIPNVRYPNRRVIPSHCSQHGGTPGFTNLVLRKIGHGRIELDPHAVGGCVIVLDEAAATELRNILTEWPG
ncbi:MAG TPA: hypothetical protein VJT72_05875 [Pseudonocardiaceae bacterium]|nr:hypothetical protein [Pseudonocardiaceae bacterium]